jgi:hypothetical protein
MASYDYFRCTYRDNLSGVDPGYILSIHFYSHRGVITTIVHVFCSRALLSFELKDRNPEYYGVTQSS